MRTPAQLIRLLALVVLIVGLVFVWRSVWDVEAHHYHHAHDGFIRADLVHYELNNRTTTGQSISIAAVGGTTQEWRDALDIAVWNWNTGMQATTGFAVYTLAGGGVAFEASYTTIKCPPFQQEPRIEAHGCVLNWFPNTPSGTVYMQDFGGNFAPGDLNHRASDVMHEMGHVLYNAGEHAATHNCSSIMGHCNNPRITTVQDHDRDDYKAAYQVREAPNATYVFIPSTTDATHYFEGGYQGGIGYTSHQERDYWIDRSTSGVNGSYSTYISLLRIVNNDDNGTPNSWVDPATYPVPWPNAEWCFKTRGRSGGVATPDPYYWGPMSKAYCISTAFSSTPGTCGDSAAVVTTTDRNGDVYFRVYNFTNDDITNVTITNTSNTTLCTMGTIDEDEYDDCHKSRSGSGTVRVWWNGTWSYCDTIMYGG